jgi:uncharacterized repeat protein (TIGR03803 family)
MQTNYRDRFFKRPIRFRYACPVLMAASCAPVWATPAFNTLLNFSSTTGNDPDVTLTFDAAGNLYGTTENGGAGYGVVYELPGPTYQTYTPLLNFNSGNGSTPEAGIAFDSAGNLYGDTNSGGSKQYGNVFELSGSTHQTPAILYNFDDTIGANPWGTLATDSAGNLYGTTANSGTHGGGTIYELSGASHQTFTSLYSFIAANGSSPQAGVIIDSAGNLYGTTFGITNKGTVYELSADHQTFTILASFNTSNGANPEAALAMDSQGNLYGTTENGGANSDGTIFELSGPNHQTLTTLLNMNSSTGSAAHETLIVDAAGDIFGTTSGGGANFSGTVFELSGTNHQTYTDLYDFSGGGPYAGLTADAQGDLFGTTYLGGSHHDGSVFELTGAGFAVPEPSSAAVLAAGLIGLLSRRRGLKSV